jgi:hypothetical protein
LLQQLKKESKGLGTLLKSRVFMITLGITIVLTCIFGWLVMSVKTNGQVDSFDPYLILQIDRGADSKAIRKTHRNLSLKYHLESIHVDPQLLLDIHLSFDPFILIAKLENSPFRACSDGSAVTQEGTYGWALSLEDGTRLAHGAGYVDGHNPRLFRAEGQGMLSVVCFIRRLLQWTCTDSILTGILATDNTGLIA